MSIFRLEWACMIVYYAQEAGKRCILVGYRFPGAVVAGVSYKLCICLYGHHQTPVIRFTPFLSFGGA